MKYIIAIALLVVCTANAGDHVTIKYQPGYNMSDRTMTILIDQSFGKSGTVIPEVFKRLKAIGELKTKGFLVPDAAHIIIIAEVDGQRHEAASCHTLFEVNGKVVAKSTGITGLNGLTRKRALSEEPEHFLEFRRLWEEAFSLAMTEVTETFSPQQQLGRDK